MVRPGGNPKFIGPKGKSFGIPATGLLGAERRFRLRTVGTWSVANKEGSSACGDCSAHYFQIQDDLVVYSWYA